MLIASVVEIRPTGGGVIRIVWVVTGTLNLAFLIAAVAMIMRFAESMAMFISYTSVVERSPAPCNGLKQFMAIAPLPVIEQSEMPRTLRYPHFDNVSYRYEEGDGYALNHVSLTFRQLVERAGGYLPRKAKLRRKLLMRYATDPQLRTISNGGDGIRRLTPEQLNSPDFCCFRDVWLFDDTLLARYPYQRAHRRRGRR